MPTLVEVPGVGEIEFPDGMTEEDIAKVLSGQLDGGSAPEPRPDDSKLAIAGEIKETVPATEPSAPSLLDRAKEFAFTPTVEIAPEVTSAEIERQMPFLSPTGAKILSGILHTTSGAINFMTSPAGLVGLAAGPASMAGGAVGLAGRGVLGAFAVDAARHLPEQAGDLIEAVKEDDVEGIARSASGAALGATVAVGGGAAAVRGASKLPVIQRINKAFELVPQETIPVKVTGKERLPDFQPADASQSMAASPRGAGRIPGLGWIMDARRRVDNPQTTAVITRQFETHVGKAIGDAVHAEFGGRIDRAFNVKDGTVEVVPAGATAPTRVPVSDAFETLQRNPQAYDLTTAQRDAFNEAMTVLTQANALARRNGVAPPAGVGLDAYFPRQRVDAPKHRTKGGGGATRVGAKQFMDRARYYKTEAEGVKGGAVYMNSIEGRVAEYVRRTYRKIADKRLSEDPALAGRPRSAGAKRMEEGIIEHPAFQDRFYPGEIADSVNNFYRSRDSSLRQALVSANSVLKQIGFTFDYAAPWIQGQVLMFRHPGIWAKASYNSVKAFFTPEVMARYAADPTNLEAMRELAQLGTRVSSLPDFLANEGLGKKISDAPGFRNFRQSFEAFLGIAQVELWKAYRDTTPREQWPAMAERLQNMMAHARMEEAGMSPGQALLERTLFLAPSFHRGAIDLVAGAFTGNSKLPNAAALGAWGLGVSMTFYALMKAAGHSDEEIASRFNPAEADFQMVPVEFDDGRARNIGFGGPLRSLMRLGAEVTEAILTDPSRLQPGADNNPVLKWLRGKASPIAGGATDILLGEDFLGNDVTWLQVLAARTLPIGAQQLVRKPGEPPVSVGDALPSFMGLQVYPEGIRSQFERHREGRARELYNKPYESLNVEQQLEISGELQRRPVFAEKQPTSKAKVARAMDLDQKRIAEVTAGLQEAVQQGVKTLELKVRSFDGSLGLGRGVKLLLTGKQLKRYTTLVSEEYDKVLADLMQTDGFSKMEPSARQKVADEVMAAAREAAKGRLFGEIEGASGQ